MFTDPVVLNPKRDVKYFKSISVHQGARQEVVFQLTDVNGKCLTLGDSTPVKASQFQGDGSGPDAVNPGFGDGLVPKGQWPDVKIRMVVSPGYGFPPIFEIDGVVTDYEKGMVLFHLGPDQTCDAGVYKGEIGLFRGEVMMASWPLSMIIELSLFAPKQPKAREGILSIPEIRMSLRDLDPSYNDLLEEVEFADAEIMQCIQAPVDLWNEMLPFEKSLELKYTFFPFRRNWMRATNGYLLEVAAHWYRRNDLAVSAGGISIQDRNKHLTYEPKSKELIAEFQAWAKQTKAAMSARMAMGMVGSPWPRSTLWQ